MAAVVSFPIGFPFIAFMPSPNPTKLHTRHRPPALKERGTSHSGGGGHFGKGKGGGGGGDGPDPIGYNYVMIFFAATMLWFLGVCIVEFAGLGWQNPFPFGVGA